MSRTTRIYNKKSSNIFEHTYKPYKLHCRCSYCIDPCASKHRRENNKLEIKRELANVCFLKDTDIHRPCYEWHHRIYIDAPGNSCNMEIKYISFRLYNEVK